MPTKDDPKGKTRKSDLPAPPPVGETLPVENAGPPPDDAAEMPPDDAAADPLVSDTLSDDYDAETVRRGRTAALSMDMIAMGLEDGMQEGEVVEAVATDILSGGPSSYATPERRAMYLLAQHMNAVHAQMRKLANSMSSRAASDPEMGVAHDKRSMHGRIDKQRIS
jgi:hypothetical protein